MGLVSVLALGVFSLNSSMQQQKTQSNSTSGADMFRKIITAQLQNPAAWRQTLNHNATFACVVGGTDCTTPPASNASNNGPAGDYTISSLANATGPCAAGVCNGGFNVYDVSGSEYYPFASNATAGFEEDGRQCRAGYAGGHLVTGAPGWSPNPTSSQCPFRLVLWWVPICQTTVGGCKKPQIRVRGYVVYSVPSGHSGATASAVKPTNYGLDLILSPNP
jgi:hypothetical protein